MAGCTVITLELTAMLGDPKVLETLNALNQAEISLHEAAHGWEKVFECLKYKKLKKWVDAELVNASRQRRRYLEKRICRLGGELAISMEPTAVNPAASVADILTAALSTAMTLWGSYQAAYRDVYAARDFTTADDLVDLQRSVESTIFDLEAFQRQVKDLELPLFISTKA